MASTRFTESIRAIVDIEHPILGCINPRCGIAWAFAELVNTDPAHFLVVECTGENLTSVCPEADREATGQRNILADPAGWQDLDDLPGARGLDLGSEGHLARSIQDLGFNFGAGRIVELEGERELTDIFRTFGCVLDHLSIGWPVAGDANLFRGREVDVAVEVSPVGKRVGVGAVGVVIRVGRAGERLGEVLGRVAGDLVRVDEARVGQVARVVAGQVLGPLDRVIVSSAAGCRSP